MSERMIIQGVFVTIYDHNKFFSVCKKYRLKFNSYSQTQYLLLCDVGASYDSEERNIFVKVSQTLLGITSGEDTDAIFRSIEILNSQNIKGSTMQFRRLMTRDYRYTNSILRMFICGIFPELLNYIETVLFCFTAETEELLFIVLSTKLRIFNLEEEDIKQRCLISCAGIVTLLPGTPTSFTIERKGTYMQLICENIWKLKQISC